MWPFKRKSSKESLNPVPEEIKAYYEAENKQSSWRIWAVSIATFVGTLVVILLLFWAGSWAYHQIKDSNKASQTNQSQKASESSKSEQSKKSEDSNSNSGSTQPKPPTQPKPTPAPAPTPTAETTPAPQPNSDQLANTGPGNLVGVFVLTSLIGAIGYRIFIGSRLTDADVNSAEL